MTQVLIVGAGPVGLMTALGLARENIEVCLIEAEDKIVYTPRAISYAWPIFTPLEALGVLDDMMVAGHTVDERTWRVFKTGETIIYNHDAVRGLTNRPYSLTLGQDRLAEVILKHLGRYPNVTIHWGTRFTSLTQSDRDVTVLADQLGETVQFKADWVVAGDGGRSAVRKSVGIPLDGFTWPQRFVATNIYFDFEKHGWNSGYLIDPVYGAVIYRIDEKSLWRFTFAEDANLPIEDALPRIMTFANTVLPGDKQFGLVLHSEYNMHQRSARSYRAGRVLLAGDAAHLTNPTSGFGLMGGLYDSFLLSETLAAVVKRDADDKILDRYSEERRKVFDEVTSPVSTESFRLVFNSDDEERFANDLKRLKDRTTNLEEMRKFASVPALLETRSLLTGQTFAERALAASPANRPTY
jgi:3-(3-hydroxy-phenyl)propionate hydroxylase/6-hydroxy-3-succinoylpyridine 3-monooxygenase